MTFELLLKNPWVVLGDAVATHPPMETQSVPASAFLHISAFSILGALGALAFTEESERNRVRYLLWLIAYAGVSEVLQLCVPGRWASGEDILFNIVGLCLGAFIYSITFSSLNWGYSSSTEPVVA